MLSVLHSSVALASKKVRAAFDVQLKPHEAAIDAAKQKADACRRDHQAAVSRVSAAEQALREVKAAQATAKSEVIAQAVTAAEQELTEARTAKTQTQERLTAAENEHRTAFQPVFWLNEALSYLSTNVTDDGNTVSIASRVEGILKEAFTQAKIPHPAIAAAEDKLASCKAALAQAEQEERNAQSADMHMQAAAKKSTVKGVQDGALETARQLSVVTAAKVTAQANLAAAEEALEEALKPILLVTLAHRYAPELVENAQRVDAAHRQRVRELEEQRDTERQAESDSDPCTCSETNCPCSYCRSRQQAIATGQWGRDDDPTR